MRFEKLFKKKFFTKDYPEFREFNIGDFTYGRPVVLYGKKDKGANLVIGKFCSIADEVVIFLGGNHRVDFTTTYPFNVIFEEFKHIEGHPTTNGDVIIGNDVWIGYQSLILSGVKIGDGAVIAARSVVTKDVEPYSIVGGHPARLIRKRFSDEIIEQLLKVQWWNWEIEMIKTFVPLLMQNRVEMFLESVKQDI